MNGKTNKWGPALANSSENTTLRPNDIAAAIAAGLSIRLGSRVATPIVPPPQIVTAEFEINDSPVSSEIT